MTLLKRLAIPFILTALILSPAFAFASEPGSVLVPPTDQLGEVLLNLITNYKTMGPIGIGIAAVILLTAAISAFVGEGAWKRLIVTILSVAYSVMLPLFDQSMTLGAVLVAVLITAGGAVAIFEAAKGVYRLYKPKDEPSS